MKSLGKIKPASFQDTAPKPITGSQISSGVAVLTKISASTFSNPEISRLLVIQKPVTFNSTAEKVSSHARGTQNETTVLTTTKKTETMLSTPVKTNISRQYVTYTVNEAVNQTKDLKALQNNPMLKKKNGIFYRHKEYVRTECIIPECNGITCKNLCDIESRKKAVAHVTHGTPPAETGKKTIPVSQTDLDGNNKVQNAVIYDKAHDTQITQEHKNGTKQLQTDPNILRIITQNEDKA